jgi:hypothetical protein
MNQLALFELGRRLEDVSIEERLAAAGQVLEADPYLSVDDRRQLLLLVVAPTLYSEVER